MAVTTHLTKRAKMGARLLRNADDMGETFALIAALAAGGPVLITVRLAFDPPWTGRGHVTTLTLNRLGRRDGAALVDKVTGGKALPANVGDRFALDGPLPRMAQTRGQSSQHCALLGSTKLSAPQIPWDTGFLFAAFAHFLLSVKMCPSNRGNSKSTRTGRGGLLKGT